jgi:hypothetical protein
MKKYLREIEISSVILTVIGIGISWIMGYQYGVWPCAVGLLLMLISFLYKAFHWKEYERDNKQNIVIILVCIFILIIQMLRAR